MSAYGFRARFVGGIADGQLIQVFHDPSHPLQGLIPKRPAMYQDIIRSWDNRLGIATGIEVITRYRLDEDAHPMWTYRLFSTAQSTVDVPSRQRDVWSYSSHPRIRLVVFDDSE